MSNLLNKWERKYGKYAIRNLTLYMIIMYVAGYIMQLTAANAVLRYLTLDVYQILHGQVWRLITWLFMPPSVLGIFTIFVLMLYYWLGNTLERQWGSFRYNLFIFSGILFTIVGAFVSYGIMALSVPKFMPFDETMQLNSMAASFMYTTYYINTSIFLAFASAFPDVKLYLYFIIPVKIKWLAAIDLALLIYLFIKESLPSKVAILASLLNVLIYFIISIKERNRFARNSARAAKAKHEYVKMMQAQIKNKGQSSEYRHKCCICGRTDVSHPDLEFRFCSKCKGAYEYCNDHLFTHIHKQ